MKDRFDKPITDFSERYADQNQHDNRAQTIAPFRRYGLAVTGDR